MNDYENLTESVRAVGKVRPSVGLALRSDLQTLLFTASLIFAISNPQWQFTTAYVQAFFPSKIVSLSKQIENEHKLLNSYLLKLIQ